MHNLIYYSYVKYSPCSCEKYWKKNFLIWHSSLTPLNHVMLRQVQRIFAVLTFVRWIVVVTEQLVRCAIWQLPPILAFSQTRNLYILFCFEMLRNFYICSRSKVGILPCDIFETTCSDSLANIVPDNNQWYSQPSLGS